MTFSRAKGHSQTPSNHRRRVEKRHGQGPQRGSMDVQIWPASRARVVISRGWTLTSCPGQLQCVFWQGDIGSDGIWLQLTGISKSENKSRKKTASGRSRASVDPPSVFSKQLPNSRQHSPCPSFSSLKNLTFIRKSISVP